MKCSETGVHFYDDRTKNVQIIHSQDEIILIHHSANLMNQLNVLVDTP